LGAIILCITGAVTCIIIRRRRIRRSLGEKILVAAPFTSINDSGPISVSGSLHKSRYPDGEERRSVDENAYSNSILKSNSSSGALNQPALNVGAHTRGTTDKGRLRSNQGPQLIAETRANNTSSPRSFQRTPTQSTRSTVLSQYSQSSSVPTTLPAYVSVHRSLPAYSDLSRNQSQRTRSEVLGYSAHDSSASVTSTQSGTETFGTYRESGGFASDVLLLSHRGSLEDSVGG
jgi:hypothetical protein